MQLLIFRSLLILVASTLWCASLPAATRPNVQDRVDRLLVANGRLGLYVNTTSAGSLIVNTPTGPVTVPAGIVTVVGPMHGAASLVKLGAGNMSIVGPNGATGATSISGGTLRFSSPQVGPPLIIGGSLNLANGNVLSLDPPAGNNSTGSGGLIVNNGSTSGSGSVTLSGSNSYSGTTTINSGTLNLSGSGTYTGGTTTTTGTLQVGTIDAGGTLLNAGGTGNTISSYNGATVVTNGTLTLAGPSAFTGSTALNAGNLAINSSGASLVKSGVGTLILGGANSYAGATVINAGTLSGIGTIGGSLIHTAGTINLGNPAAAQSIGTLTFNGPLMLNGGTMQYDVDGSQLNVDSVRVIGGLSTAGSTPINLEFLNPGSVTSSTFGSTLFTYNGLANSSGLTINTWSSTSDTLDQIHLIDSTGSSDSITLGPVSAVPEPAAWTLGLIALTLLLLSRRLGI